MAGWDGARGDVAAGVVHQSTGWRCPKFRQGSPTASERFEVCGKESRDRQCIEGNDGFVGVKGCSRRLQSTCVWPCEGRASWLIKSVIVHSMVPRYMYSGGKTLSRTPCRIPRLMSLTPSTDIVQRPCSAFVGPSLAS